MGWRFVAFAVGTPEGPSHVVDPRERGVVAGVRSGTYDALLLALLAAVAAILISVLRNAFGVDTWLALATGRAVWQGGIPHHDTLSVLTHGVTWVDQQWLAQLATYAIDRLGGLGLVGVANVALLVSGLAGAAFAARRLGVRARTLIICLPVAVWFMIPAAEVRTQAFAVPLFVLTFYLVAADSRAESLHVFWTLPVIALWANLHGSATLGAGLVALRGLTLAWERRASLAGHLGRLVRPLGLIVGGPLALFVTPYGVSIVGYYHSTLINSALKHAVTEWQPVTASAFIAVPFFATAALALWSFGRAPTATTPWEKLALIALAVGGIDAIRNVVWFALGAVIVLGASIDAVAGPARGGKARLRPRLNRACATGAVVVVLVAAVATIARPARAFESVRLRHVLAAVQRSSATDPLLRVFADQRVADWLLWQAPSLRGRIAFDVRFELLSARLLRRVQRFNVASGADWKTVARGYRLLVLDEEADPLSAAELRREPGRQILYDDRRFVVILRSPAEAG